MKEAFPFLFFGVALYILGRLYLLKKNSVPVQIKVIKQKIDWGQDTTMSPVFEVASGEYTGKTAKSEVGLSFPIHSVGSTIKGLYHPNSGAIESNTTLAIWRFLGWFILLGSTGFLVWRHARPLLLP